MKLDQIREAVASLEAIAKQLAWREAEADQVCTAQAEERLRAAQTMRETARARLEELLEEVDDLIRMGVQR